MKQNNKIVKIFTDKSIVIEDFENELKSNRKLNSIYGKKSSKYITLTPILKFKNVELMGCVININENKRDSLHLLFGTMCKNDHKINKTDKLNKFMIHILKSLIILQKRGYSHNDIREDNTVSSNNFYKLIDWGRLRKVDDIGKENVFGLEYHPLFMYLHNMKIPKNCKNLIDLVTIIHKQVEPSFLFFGLLGFPGGNLTYYLPPGTIPIASVSNTTSYPFTFIQIIIIFSIYVTFSGTINIGDSLTFTIYKNNIITGLSITLTSLSPSTVTLESIGITFLPTDLIDVRLTTVGSPNAGTFT